MAGVDPAEVLVSPTGKLLLAPEGTAGPTDLVAAWPAAWVDLGYLSQDAITMGAGTTKNEVKAWQADAPIWSNLIVARTFHFQLLQWNPATMALAFGGGDSTPATGSFTFETLPQSAYVVQALGIELVDGPEVTRIYVPRMKVSDFGNAVFKGDAAAVLELTVDVLDNGSSSPLVFIISDPSLPLADEASAPSGARAYAAA